MKKVALITGGSRGIGFGVALELAKNQFDIVINGMRDESSVSEAIKELQDLGAEVLYCQGNVASTEDRASILAKIKERFGRLNVLVNNAGVAPSERKDILDASEESYERVMKINLQGPYFLTQAVANYMIEQRNADSGFEGCIINVSSVSTDMVSVNRGEYCISKSGMAMMTQLFAVRMGEFDIPVFEIRPGVIKTDMTAGVKEKYDALIEEGLFVQPRWGLPSDIGKAAAALALKYFPYSTGQVIMVDGGMTIARL
ncbi:3-ketoacyl-ACP reductase [Membranihabitans marinus]|uniref:3-ketoacyl-ACP reductase n=1 Tax=Membranihabitans marinus TaxID=1227546 RepID=UPI001F0206D2|nr:3-ketoacyl-ACP reductase [Membranihabitans marinus]